MLRALIIKDIRLVQLIIVLAFSSVPIILLLSAIVCFTTQDTQFSGQSTAETLASAFGVSDRFLLMISYFTVTLIAGSIIAEERQDRTAEFLGCLPPLRWHTILSKGSVVAGFIASWLIIQACIHFLTYHLERSAGSTAYSDGLTSVGAVAGLLVGCGGVAWACSALSRTTVVPIVIGFIAPGLVIPLVGFLYQYFEVSVDLTDRGRPMYNAVCMLGCAGFIAGAVFYLLRREE